MSDPNPFAADIAFELAQEAIKAFKFWNYGMDDVDPLSEYAEWVPDLARHILEAVIPAIRAAERAEVAAELDALQSDPPTIAYGAACVECNEDFEAGERVTWRWRYAPAGLIHDACRWDGDNAVLTEAQIRAAERAKVAEMLRDHAAGHRRTAERRGAMQYELVRRAVALEAAAAKIARGEER